MIEDILQKCCELISGAFNINCFYLNANGYITDNNILCKKCSMLQKENCNHVECENLHLESLIQSKKWGYRYEYMCPLGLSFISCAVLVGGHADYAMITGPFLMMDYDDFLDEELPNLFHDKNTFELENIARTLPYVKFERVQFISEIVHMITNDIVKTSRLWLNGQETLAVLGNETYEMLYIKKENEHLSVLQQVNEKKLMDAMIEGDEAKAISTINDILSEVYMSAGGKIEYIKNRIINIINKILVKAINLGSNISNILLLNGTYVSEIQKITDAKEADELLLYVIRNIMNNIFSRFGDKNTSAVNNIIEYISQNYMKKIKLNELANEVMLSVPYMCKIFKERTFMSIGSYINMIRIKNSKVLLKDIDITLIDIASMVGFDDQSYFTKIFKKIVGVSPGKYRQINSDTGNNYEE